MPSRFPSELQSEAARKIHPEKICSSDAQNFLQNTKVGDPTTPKASEAQTNYAETKSQRRDPRVAVAPTNAVLPTLASDYGCKWCDARFERSTQLGQHVAHKHPGKSKQY